MALIIGKTERTGEAIKNELDETVERLREEATERSRTVQSRLAELEAEERVLIGVVSTTTSITPVP